jgi:hypothetical protein
MTSRNKYGGSTNFPIANEPEVLDESALTPTPSKDRANVDENTILGARQRRSEKNQLKESISIVLGDEIEQALALIDKFSRNIPDAPSEKKPAALFAVANPKDGLKTVVFNQEIYGGGFGIEFKTNLSKDPKLGNRIFSDVSDPFRYSSGKYWSFDSKNKPIFVNKDFLNLQHIATPYNIFMEEDPSYVSHDATFFIDRTIVGLLPNQSLFSHGPDNDIFDKTLWNAYLNGGSYNGSSFDPIIDTHRTFEDIAFEIFEPSTLAEINILGSSLATRYADIFPTYNFYLKPFEETIVNPLLSENVFPNIYSLLSQIVEGNEETFGDKKSVLHNTLGGTLETVLRKIKKGGGKTGQLVDSGQYFEEWAQKVSSLKESTREQLSNQFKYIGFSIFDLETSLFKDAEQRARQFPLFMGLEFSSDTSTEFAQSLRDSRLSKDLTRHVMKRDVRINEFEKKFEKLKATVFNETSVIGTGPVSDYIARLSSISKDVELNVFDVPSWWLGLEEKEIEPAPKDVIIIGPGLVDPVAFENAKVSGETRVSVEDLKTETVVDKVLPVDAFSNNGDGDDVVTDQDLDKFNTFLNVFVDGELHEETDESRYYTQILRIIFAGKLRKIIKKHFRTYKEMMSGRLAYSEAALYKITKHSVLPTGEAAPVPLQSFYLPNSNTLDVIKFIDTQVKYDKEYIYKISVYQVVIGTRYEYVSLDNEKNQDINFIQTEDPTKLNSLRRRGGAIDPSSQQGLRNGLATFAVLQEPLIKLVEVPYFEFSTRKIVDSFPLPPEIDFIPFKDVATEVAFNLTNQTGLKIEKPIALEDTDLEIFDRAFKNKPDLKDKIFYQADDVSSFFEIFRITKHPKEYSEFKNNKIAKISTALSDTPNVFTSGGTFFDKIKTNKKYYYIFRTIDVHGNISNPSNVYELEMIQNSGVLYPIWRAVPLKEVVVKRKTKNVKKFLRITTAFPQQLLNMEASNITLNESPVAKRDLQLGIADESVWNRKLKIRLTSKETGKKIDLNLKFIYDIKALSFNFTPGASLVGSTPGDSEVIAESFTGALYYFLLESIPILM